MQNNVGAIAAGLEKLTMICSPLYVLVAYVWDIVRHILFSGVYIKPYIGDCFFVVL